MRTPRTSALLRIADRLDSLAHHLSLKSRIDVHDKVGLQGMLQMEAANLRNITKVRKPWRNSTQSVQRNR